MSINFNIVKEKQIKFKCIFGIIILLLGIFFYLIFFGKNLLVESCNELLARCIFMLVLLNPFYIIVYTYLEKERSLKHGETIIIGKKTINTKDIDYNKRLEFVKDSEEDLEEDIETIKIQKEHLEYLLKTKYKYNSVNYYLELFTIPAVIVFINNILNLTSKVKEFLNDFQDEARIGGTIFFIYLILCIILMTRKISWKNESKNEIHRALVKIRDDLNYCINSKTDTLIKDKEIVININLPLYKRKGKRKFYNR